MARAGRPRTQGPRTKSGRLKQQHDAGTDELRAKKVALVGPGGDPSKSTNTIDILESWGHLTKDQSRSLHYFVTVRSLMIAKAAPRSISIEGIKGTPPEVWMSDNQALWWWYCYREMDRAIPSHSKNHVRRIIFDDLLLKWFHTTKQAQVAINVWLRQYNRIRPHHALGIRPPVPETRLETPKMNGRI